MADNELHIDLTPSDDWAGPWFATRWRALALGRSPDPAHLAGRLLAKARVADSTDVLVLRLDGREIAREKVESALKRRACKDALARFWKKPEPAGAAIAPTIEAETPDFDRLEAYLAELEPPDIDFDGFDDDMPIPRPRPRPRTAAKGRR